MVSYGIYICLCMRVYALMYVYVYIYARIFTYAYARVCNYTQALYAALSGTGITFLSQSVDLLSLLLAVIRCFT